MGGQTKSGKFLPIQRKFLEVWDLVTFPYKVDLECSLSHELSLTINLDLIIQMRDHVTGIMVSPAPNHGTCHLCMVS